MADHAKPTRRRSSPVRMADAQALAEVQQGFTKVARDQLLAIVKENKAKHEEEHQLAVAGWRKEYCAALRKLAHEIAIEENSVENGKAATLNVRLATIDLPSMPKSHAQDYARVIRRLELSNDEFHHVSHKDFDSFVLDEWSWKHEHRALLSSYTEARR